MGIKKFNLPDPGEGLTEAEIVSWKVKPGDEVKVNQIVVEIETSKSLVELPIPWDGTVTELLAQEGTEVEVGSPIIAIEVVGAGDPVPSAGDAAPPTDAAEGWGGAAAPEATAPQRARGASAPAPQGSSSGGDVKTFRLPDPGEGLTEAEIVSWKVKPGDEVKVNQIVLEVETSKSLVELPIPWDGTVVELLAQEGTEVPVGDPIITIRVAGSGGDAPAEEAKREPNLVGYGEIAGSTTRRARRGRSAPPAPAAAASPPPPAAPAAPAAAPAAAPPAPAAPAAASGSPVARSGRPLAKPPVRKFAKDNGVDLALVAGSGKDGIITRADVEAYLSGGQTSAAETPAVAEAPSAAAAPARPAGERETRTPVKGVRKMTAQAMSASKFSAPHVTEFVTIDVTATMELVERLKGDREFRDVKVTPLLVVAKALLLACRRNPGVNAQWVDEPDGSAVIVQKNYVNLGIAAATPRGLIVPNIKDADAMTMRELADAMGRLVDVARAGKTQPADMSGGTITITNVGVFGVDTGTPIINPGESAIFVFGAIRRQPWVVGTGADERIEPRWVTQLGLSFDHRLIDGDLGSRFLADVAAVLEDPARGLVWG
ncbi:2-oxo acid dehydrogenase subunit E2 [Mobilicoccus caccae]|uniref:Dihydrolipoamide acetyltransferase component of pyruvate dehydrogenase complex n=1 Tax=Mobilicoccus caccae TaxID=1859295 RepID=A0ABQ6IVM1_9MICO|nr:2-oxo acid dehydrogenase subunit E2 [Mobilicoccus caccae]GMA41192.1 dihydrolipoamide acetyltransferase component of pyruvate dehydrogenase complex [Mobilicoccus caccae]